MNNTYYRNLGVSGFSDTPPTNQANVTVLAALAQQVNDFAILPGAYNDARVAYNLGAGWPTPEQYLASWRVEMADRAAAKMLSVTEYNAFYRSLLSTQGWPTPVQYAAIITTGATPSPLPTQIAAGLGGGPVVQTGGVTAGGDNKVLMYVVIAAAAYWFLFRK